MGENFEHPIDNISSIAEQVRAILSLEGFQVKEVPLQEIFKIADRLNTLYLDSDRCAMWIETATSIEEHEFAWECLDLTLRSITALLENKYDIEDSVCKFHLVRTLNYKIERVDLDNAVMVPLKSELLLRLPGVDLYPIHYYIRHIVEKCEYGYRYHSFLTIATKFVDIACES